MGKTPQNGIKGGGKAGFYFMSLIGFRLCEISTHIYVKARSTQKYHTEEKGILHVNGVHLCGRGEGFIFFLASFCIFHIFNNGIL